MLYRLIAIAVALVISAGGLLADDQKTKDKDKKKEPTSVKGKVVKFDKDKKCIKLKTADGEKEFTTGDEIQIAFPQGRKVTASLKKEADSRPQQRSRFQPGAMLNAMLREGNEVELVLSEKDNTVKEVRMSNATGSRRPPGPPAGKPPLKGAPDKD